MIAVALNLSMVLEVERCAGVQGIVVVTAHGKPPLVPVGSGHAPWVTAFGAQCLGGKEIEPIPAVSAPLMAAVEGLTFQPVVNQGLLDRGDRSAVVQTLSFLRARGVRLEPDGVMVEALRNQWGRTGPEEIRQIALDLNRGKRLKFDKRIRPERLEEWAAAQ